VLLSLLGFQAFGLPGFIIGLAMGSAIGIFTVQVWMFRKGLVLSFYELKLSSFFFLIIALYYGALFVIDGVYQKEILAFFITVLAASFLFFSYKTQIIAYVRERRVTAK
jgi:Ca2+/Na+ antiporter